jgi:hypothetical protein
LDVLVSGVLAGVVAALIWALLVALYRANRLKREFGPLSGTYRVTRKLSDQPEPETVSISVKRNVLTVQSQGGDLYSGEIAMSEQFLASGKGQYHQAKDGAQLWGFWDVQRKDEDTILVHTTYANPQSHAAVVSGFVWKRIRR